MTDQDRDRIRDLQDAILDHPVTRRFIAQRGPREPLWVGGPNGNDLHDMLWPKLEAEMRNVLADLKGGA